jgi:phenylacetate-CoA ligase
MDALGIRVAFVTSERLYDEQRETIAAVFGCPVANGYGGRDAGFIAHECPSGRMHISAEDIVVEILDDRGNAVPAGEAGEIVVTHLATGDFPFVRYRTGDVGVLDPQACPCGRGLPVLKEIQGRSTDFVVASDGTVMHGLALIYAIRDLPGIERFKIVQHDLMHTEVLLVPGSSYQAAHADTIRAAFLRRLGTDVDVAIRLVDAIPSEASGKFRYVVSKVEAAAHGARTPAARSMAHA